MLPGNAIRLQGRCDRQTDGLFRAAEIRYYEVGVQWIQPTLDALHTRVKRFQVTANVGSLLHASVTPSSLSSNTFSKPL